MKPESTRRRDNFTQVLCAVLAILMSLFIAACSRGSSGPVSNPLPTSIQLTAQSTSATVNSDVPLTVQLTPAAGPAAVVLQQQNGTAWSYLQSISTDSHGKATVSIHTSGLVGSLTVRASILNDAKTAVVSSTPLQLEVVAHPSSVSVADWPTVELAHCASLTVHPRVQPVESQRQVVLQYKSDSQPVWKTAATSVTGNSGEAEVVVPICDVKKIHAANFTKLRLRFLAVSTPTTAQAVSHELKLSMTAPPVFYLDASKGCYSADYPATDGYPVDSSGYKTMYAEPCDQPHHMEVFWVGIDPTGRTEPTNDSVRQVCEGHFQQKFGSLPSMADFGAQLNWFYPDAGPEANAYPGKIICYTRIAAGNGKVFSIIDGLVPMDAVAQSDGAAPYPNSPPIDGSGGGGGGNSCDIAYSNYINALDSIDRLLTKEASLESGLQSAAQDLADARANGSLLDLAGAQSYYNGLLNQLVDTDAQLQDMRSAANNIEIDASEGCTTATWPPQPDPLPWDDGDTSILG